MLHIQHNNGEGINDFRWNPTWREGINKSLLFKGRMKRMSLFPIFLFIFRQSTKTKILKVSTSLEKKKRLFKRDFKLCKGKE